MTKRETKIINYFIATQVGIARWEMKRPDVTPEQIKKLENDITVFKMVWRCVNYLRYYFVKDSMDSLTSCYTSFKEDLNYSEQEMLMNALGEESLLERGF